MNLTSDELHLVVQSDIGDLCIPRALAGSLEASGNEAHHYAESVPMFINSTQGKTF